jgi:ATP-dependent helicase/nuclease subunit A
VAASTSVTELKTLLAMQGHPSVQMIDEMEEQTEASTFSENRGLKDGSSTFKLHLRRPKFMEEKQLTGAERGTVYHTLMQHLPVDGSLVDSHIVEQTLLRLVELQILLPHQAEMIDSEQLAGFFYTEPGTELLRAEWVKREIPFIYGLPAHQSPAEWLHELSPNAGMQTLEEDGKMQASLENETVLVQGIIDCLYEVGGELVLLDYKTDQVLEHRGGLDKLTENYRFQLELYGRAIEDILGRRVDRKWLYFFDGGYAVKL